MREEGGGGRSEINSKPNNLLIIDHRLLLQNQKEDEKSELIHFCNWINVVVVPSRAIKQLQNYDELITIIILTK